jgi:hypothetical protein
MQKIIILNQQNWSIHVFDFDEDLWDLNERDIQEFYDSLNIYDEYEFQDDECSYMLVDELNIQIH